MSKTETFKFAIRKIAAEAAVNPSSSAELAEMLCAALEQEIGEKTNFDSITSSLNDISGHLLLTYNRLKIKGQDVFGRIKHDKLREFLIDCYAKQLQAVENRKPALACKTIFQQIESLLNFLMSTRNCLEEVRKDEGLMKKYYVYKNPKGYINFTLKNKIFVASDFFKSELQLAFPKSRTLSTQFYDIKDEFDVCYDLRHSDSHGLLFDENESELIAIRKFSDNPTRHLTALDRLVKNLIGICLQIDA